MYNIPFSNLNKKTLVIVDANAFVYSSFYGCSEKLDIKGQDHRVLHGLLNVLVKLTYELDKIDYLFLIFDPDDGHLFRESQYPSYKRNRPPIDTDLIRQRNAAKIIFKERLGIPIVHYSGYEADDIIGSLAKIASKYYQVIIVSHDKDIAQLVDDNIFLLRSRHTKNQKGYVLMDESVVKKEFGVYPKQIPDWLALMGDSSDNLPGLENIGEKTAAKILSLYPSIEHLLSIAHCLDDKKLKEKILAARDNLLLVKKLATIVTDLPIAELVNEAIKYSNLVRNSPTYKEDLLRLEKYFNWKSYYKEMFL